MVTIAPRFNGPAHSGNGGYCCGLIADELGVDGPSTATLRLPPPLGVPLTWERAEGTLRLLTAGGAVVGEGAPGAFERDAPHATADEARAGAQAYRGHTDHPFAACFTCGPDRVDGDGLRVFSGPVGGDATTTAAPWIPHANHADADGRIPTPVVWAAIDCAGGWTADFTVTPTVLGRMTGEVLRTPEVDEPCVVVGHQHAHDGRKVHTSTALWSGDELLARSEQVWIEVDPTLFE